MATPNPVTDHRTGRWRLRGLWSSTDFLKLWAGETISLLGSQLTALALPLLAANLLDASPGQMGFLGFVQYLPWLVVGLFAGVWVDHLRRRPLMVSANLCRTGLMVLIAAAALIGSLRIEQLYLIGFLFGSFTVLFDVAYVAYLPSLIDRDQLMEGNSNLQLSASAAEIAGPGLAGFLVQLASAPIAIAADAFSFAVSALSITSIRKTEPSPEHGHSKPALLKDASDGLRIVLNHRLLRGFVGCSTFGNIAIDAHLAVYLLYLTRVLGVGAGTIGLLYSLAGAGGLVGASLSERLVARLGMGRATTLSQLCHGVCMTAIPLAALLGAAALPLIGLAHFLWGLTAATYLIPGMSLRQAITPAHLQGRVTASQRFLTYGLSPIGFLIGGLLGEAIGLWPALLVAGVSLLLSNLWLRFSPLPGIRDVRSIPAELLVTDAA
ncbi:MAG: MFS transporter [Anaerolineales bacterium]|nr:MFS transporter [Anaerolineales bacterium]